MRWRSLSGMLVAALAGVPTLAACDTVGGALGPTVRGSGQVASEARDVRDFTGVAVAGSGTLMIEQTGTESLTIQAEDNILPLLTSDVSNGTLRLGTRSNTRIISTQPIRYRLTVKNLDSIMVAGSADTSAPNLKAATLTVVISGSGNVTVGGAADTQDVQISGSGAYSAKDLESKAVRARVSGSGDIVVRASDTLDATVSGSGSITYSGDPTVQSRVSGSGTITKR
ncbi:MAG: head GIN domain-containing protein [Egibacteraceae bacterium]